MHRFSRRDMAQAGYKKGAVFLRGDTNAKFWKKYGEHPHQIAQVCQCEASAIFFMGSLFAPPLYPDKGKARQNSMVYMGLWEVMLI